MLFITLEATVINRKQLLTVYLGLPSSVYVLFFSRIVNSMGNLVYPFLTLYLTTKIGYSTAAAGLFMTLVSFVYAPASMLGGKLTDRFGRKFLLVSGQAVSALCLIPLAFWGTSWVVPILLVTARFFGFLVEPAYGALVTDLTTSDNRKSTFSLLYLGINIGSAVGPMVAGFFFRSHLPLLFIGDAATTLLSVALIAALVPETHPEIIGVPTQAAPLPEAEQAATGSVLSVLWRRPILVIVALLQLPYNLVYSQAFFTLPIHMNSLFGDGQGPVYYGSLMSVNAITVVALTSLITAATLRVRPLINVGLAGVAYALGFGMIYFIRSQPLFIVSTVIWTTGEILMSINWGVFVADNSPASHRGRINAALGVIGSAGWTLSPWLAGLWLRVHPVQTLWAVCFFSVLVAAVLILITGGVGRSAQREAAEAAEAAEA